MEEYEKKKVAFVSMLLTWLIGMIISIPLLLLFGAAIGSFVSVGSIFAGLIIMLILYPKD